MNYKYSSFFDCLYGNMEFPSEISSLIFSPVVQRLRHVRLSNIDSLDMPGIANISRYEHVLGVTYLALHLRFLPKISEFDRLALIASALLHDWAITAFGHLLEEALQYVGTGFDHQEHFSDLSSGIDVDDLGGVNQQIFLGRETGLRRWARTVAEGDDEALLAKIAQLIRGQGLYGKLICGDIDLDNIDNVFRAAYHIGIDVDRSLPIRLAAAISENGPSGNEIRFASRCLDDIGTWLNVRNLLYNRFMLSERDFTGKLMLLYAATKAFSAGEIVKSDWSLTDDQFLQKLLKSNVSAVRDASARWLSGELWNITPLYWFDGRRPPYSDVLEFSTNVSEMIGRECFTYCIKDKRVRRLLLSMDDGTQETLGDDSNMWILGVGSPSRTAFSKTDLDTICTFAASFFGSKCLRQVERSERNGEVNQPCLL